MRGCDCNVKGSFTKFAVSYNLPHDNLPPQLPPQLPPRPFPVFFHIFSFFFSTSSPIPTPVSFSETSSLIHLFAQPFTFESGVKIFQSFTFDQTKTNVKTLIEKSFSITACSHRVRKSTLFIIFLLTPYDTSRHLIEMEEDNPCPQPPTPPPSLPQRLASPPPSRSNASTVGEVDFTRNTDVATARASRTLKMEECVRKFDEWHEGGGTLSSPENREKLLILKVSTRELWNLKKLLGIDDESDDR